MSNDDEPEWTPELVARIFAAGEEADLDKLAEDIKKLSPERRQALLDCLDG